MNKKTNINNATLVFEELEPRLLLSADGLGVITESSVATLQTLVHSENENIIIVQHQTEQSSTVIQNKVQSDNRSELVIIDSRAPNFQQLHNDVIKAQQQGRDINVVILDAHRDGIEQISEALSKYNKLDAVHIISHGKDAQLQLGATQLNSQNLKQRSDEINKWQQVFTDGGDLLIYGCNLAGSTNGTDLVNSLSTLTGADIAASDDVTGNNILGGDWDLEYQTGDIETSIAFTDDIQDNWQGTLNADALAASEQQALVEEEQAQEEQETALLAESEAVLLAEEKEAEADVIINSQQAEQQAGIVEEQRLEIVFIDDSVDDYQAFIEDLNNNNDGSINYEVVLLDSNRNGIEQISETLAAFADVDAVHIFSHGNDGTVKLGNTWLNANNIDDYSDSVNSWANSLDKSADILIYGCNLAESASGVSFVNQLAQLTGTDVAASDDKTGIVTLGGDWELEYEFGDIETELAVSSELQSQWNSILATPEITSNGGGLTASINVVENSTAVTTVTATDADFDTLTYSISGGTDAVLYSVDASTGELTFISAPDFETPTDSDTDNVYEVIVQASDGSTADTQTISVTVTDIVGNEPPVITNNDPAINYTENDPATILFANATVFDSDSPDYQNGTLTVSFSAGGTINDELTIVENGTVTLSGAAGNINVNSNKVGVFTGGTGGTPLVIIWDNGSLDADVQAVLQQIAYLNTSDNPDATNRTIDFVLTDGDGGTSDTAQQTVNFTAVNDDPLVAANQGITMAQGATAIIPNAILRLTDPDNTATEVTYTLTITMVNGTLELNGTALALNDTFTQADIDNDLLTYVHGNADTNPDSFTFTAADGVGGNLGATTFDITILTDPPGNDAPVLSMTGAAVNYTTNDPATITDVTATVLDIDSANFKGGVLTVSISAGGTVNDELSIIEGGVTTLANGNVKVNSHTVGSFSGGTGGTDLVIIWSNLATPATVQAVLQNIGYHNTSADPSTAPRTIDFVTDDGDGGTSNIAQQTVNFTTPIITSDGGGDTASINVAENTTAVTTVTATDPNFDTLTYSISGGADAALFSIDANSGALSFISAPNFEAPTDVGANNVYDVIVQVSDGILIDIQAISVTVTDINDAPVANNDIASVNEGQSVNIDLATNDTDTEGAVDLTSIVITSAPSNGSVVVNADGTVDYTHDDSETIADSFTYTILDASGAVSNVATVSLTINPVNDAPTASNDTLAAVDEAGTAILNLAVNDFDSDNALDLNSIAIISAPVNGSLIVNGDGTVTYTHDGSETISDSFSYTIADVSGAISNTASVTITVNSLNDAPSAIDDALAVDEGNAINIDLAANDIDADNALDLNSIVIVGAPVNGTLFVNGNGTVDYTHNGSETGSDSFTYTITDISGAISNVATVNIVVNSVNDMPTTVGITNVTVLEDPVMSSTIDLNAAFDDADNVDSDLTYTITGNTRIGLFDSAAVNAATGELVLDYAANMNGSSQISIRATDPSGASVDTLFTVTVTPVNDAPVVMANTGLVATDAGSTAISNVQLNVNDVDNSNAEIIYTITELPGNGVLTINGVVATIGSGFSEDDIINNRLSYQPGGTGVNDQFGFTVSDGAGGSITGNSFNIVVQLAAVPPEEPLEPEVTIEPEKPEEPVTAKELFTPVSRLAPIVNEGFKPIGGSSTPQQQQPELTLEPVVVEEVPKNTEEIVETYMAEEEPEVSKVDFSTARSFADVQIKSIAALWIAIDEMKQEMSDNVTENISNIEFRAAAISSSGVVLTAGVVAWVLRSGALMASLISTIPLWKGYDPLPLLVYKDDKEKEKVTEDKIPTSLEELKKVRALKEKREQQIKVDRLFGHSGIGE